MGDHPATDTELVKRFKNGDRTAFTALVDRYKDRVFTLCLRWMGDPHSAEDVAQDVFIALYRSLPSFRGDSQLSTWVYRVVINHCKNRKMYRRRRHFDHHEPLEGEHEEDEPRRQIADDGPGTDAPLRAAQAERLLDEALGNLDDEQRSILMLREMQDLSYEEIAELLSLPRGTVKSRLHRARQELAALLSRRLAKEDLT
jgi:RNA polymerase sigma-70 factor (ECF subfamily)